MRSRTMRAGAREADRRGGRVRPLALAAALAAAGAALWAGPMGWVDTAEPILGLSWWMVAIVVFAGEHRVVHVHLGGDAHSFSLSEAALVVGLFALAPGELLLAVLTGGGAALLRRRQSAVKVLFNLSHFALGATAAALVFHGVLGSGGPLDPRTWAGTLLAALVSALIGLLAVEAVIALCQGRVRTERLAEIGAFGVASAVANSSLGLIGVSLYAASPGGLALLVVPAVTLHLAYRAFLAERQRRARIEFLFEASRVLHRSGDAEHAIPELLAHAGETFRAGVAELTLFPPSEDDTALRTTWRHDGRHEPIRPVDPDPSDMLVASLAADGDGLLLSGDDRSIELPAALTRRRLTDAMVVAVEGDAGPIGTILLGNRLGAVSRFDREELQLLETLANHVGIALEKGELARSLLGLREREHELRHQALHDPLTGLPNRVLLQDRLELALRRRSHQALALLFVDLDGFKAVNDSLGHAAGDEVLRAVAGRLQRCIRPDDTAARFGGDEFAVLLEGAETAATAGRVAERIVRDLSAPLLVGECPVTIGASVGVALGVPGDVSAADLLADADTAMYAAKAAGKGTVKVLNPVVAGAHEAAGGVR